MLKKVRLISGLMVITVAATWLIGSQLSAGSSTPGTVNDPIVTRSYVDKKVGDLQLLLTEMLGQSGTGSTTTPIPTADGVMSEDDTKAYIDQQLALRLAAELSGQTQTGEPATTPVVSEANDDGAKLFEVVEALNGQRLICGASAELILRAGSATVIAGAQGDGLANLTNGDNLLGGAEVPQQHHLLVSRDDGRGFLITSNDPNSEIDAYILVKGAYTLE